MARGIAHAIATITIIIYIACMHLAAKTLGQEASRVNPCWCNQWNEVIAMKRRIQSQSLSGLWDEYQRRMETAGYTANSISTFRQAVDALDDYMLAHGINEYRAEVGELFISEVKGDGRKLTGWTAMMSGVVNHLDGCLSGRFWAEDYRLHGYAIRNSRLKELWDKLVEDIAFWKLKERTVRRITVSVKRLDLFMCENGIDEYSPETGRRFIECMRNVSGLTPGFFRIYYENTIRRLDACHSNDRAYGRVPPGYEFKNARLRQAAEELAEVLGEKQYKSESVKGVQALAMKLDIFMDQYGIDEYTPETGNRFVEYYKKQVKPRNEDGPAVPFIAHLNTLLAGEEYCRYHRKTKTTCPEEFEESLGAYLEDCRERGNSTVTIYEKRLGCIAFFKKLADNGVAGIGEATADCIMENGCQLSGNARMTVREYLKSCASHQFTGKDYSFLIPRKKLTRKLPPYYDKDERTRLEKAPDRSTPIGKRDYAIILLLNRLCLRSSDVRLLKFDSLNREAKTIEFVQYKTGNRQVLPLLDEIEGAIDNYVRNGRPRSESEFIFLMSVAPYYPLSSMAIHGIVTKNLVAAGVDISGRKHGGHALRSSTCTDMVNNGFTYDETRHAAGHKDKSVILRYAALDVEHLCKCSTRCPEPTGNFRNALGI